MTRGTLAVKQWKLEIFWVFNFLTSRQSAWQSGAICKWLTAKAIPVMRFHQPRHVWTDRHDLGGVNLGVHHEVVLLNFGEIGGVTKAWDLEELLQVAADIRHLRQLVAGALEVAVVHRIEANEGYKETDIGLSDVIANHVTLLAQAFFYPVQC